MLNRRAMIKTVGALSLAASALTTKSVLAQRNTTVVAGGSRAAELPRGVTLLSINQRDGSETLGVKTPNGILDVVKANVLLNTNVPVTLEALLRGGAGAELTSLVAAAARNPAAASAYIPESSIRYGRLFTSPGKIVCVGLNYREHVEETHEELPKVPILFNKYNNTLAAHRSTIKLPPRDVAYKFDYETELLIVIGKTARNVSEADALDYVAGYAVGHDFTARDLQMDTGGQWMVGKTLDDFAPIGPYFVSADVVGDPNNLSLQTRVNGQVRQSSNTSRFIFNTQAMIAYTSKLFALEPGDIIFTGTPPGVILGKPKDQQIWLKAGDKIESTIEKLGTLQFDLA
ncbi:fumarylacetoacetate hydrolase family protein [Paraburkholderia xenovorans]|uniref:fumarylacetoacetate hydrolase family protein n=1 Tax=Paraburkholderia xenovorans TaxID=36873 RepID=UPI0038BC4580